MSVTSLRNDLDGYWPLDTDGSDGSGNNLDGTLEGDASITSTAKVGSGALTLDGDGDYLALPDDDLINLADTRTQRTIAVWFQVDDPSISSRKQVIWEEGAQARGLNIYVFDGQLYVGGWNDVDEESGWAGSWISTANISASTWHQVVLTLKGGVDVEGKVLAGYLDGERFGMETGSQVWSHGGDVAAGAVDQDTVFHDGAVDVDVGHELAGKIDDVRMYNRTLGTFEVQGFLIGRNGTSWAGGSLTRTPTMGPPRRMTGRWKEARPGPAPAWWAVGWIWTEAGRAFVSRTPTTLILGFTTSGRCRVGSTWKMPVSTPASK